MPLLLAQSALRRRRRLTHASKAIGALVLRAVSSCAIGALVIGSVLCCAGGDPVALRLDLPLEGSERSAIVAVTSDDTEAIITLEAREIVDGEIQPVLAPVDSTVELTFSVALYADALDALELQEGRINPVVSGTPRRSFPPPARLIESRVSGGKASAWRSLEALTPALSKVTIPAARACAPLAQTGEPRRFPSTVADAVAISRLGNSRDDAVLLRFANRTASVLDKTSLTPISVPLLTEVPGQPNARVYGMHHDFGAHVWLTVEQGELWEAEYSDSEKRLDTNVYGFLRTRQTARWLSGPHGKTGATELFVLTEKLQDFENPPGFSGFVERFELGAKTGTQLGYFPVETSTSSNPGGIAWGGPSRALALWPYRRAKGNLAMVHGAEVETLDGPGAQSVAYPTGVGAMVGTATAGLFRIEAGSLRALEGGPNEVQSLVGRPLGFLVASSTSLQRYVAGSGYCPERTPLPIRPRRLVPVGSDVVVIGEDSAVWLEAR